MTGVRQSTDERIGSQDMVVQPIDNDGIPSPSTYIERGCPQIAREIKRIALFLCAACLAATLAASPALAKPGDPKGGDPAVSALQNATDPSKTQDDGGQKAITEQAIVMGVDPLSLITVTPGGPPVRIPTAVPDPIRLGEPTDDAGLARTLTDVIRNDLAMSGLFEVLPVDTYGLVDAAKEGIAPSTIQYDSWYNVGASILVKTFYTFDHGEAEFSFVLFNIESAAKEKFTFDSQEVTASNVRSVAHSFVNKLIGFYTGTDGVFGTRILFAQQGKNNMRTIRAMDSDGFGASTYDLPEAINVMPEWGPKGSILFTQLLPSGDNIVHYDGKELHTLTDFEGWASGADYCPKNGKIAFTGAREANSDIYVMNADGTELARLTDMPDSIQTSPSWSPDCKRIAFVSSYTGHPQIYVMNADGTGMRRITWVGNYNTTPDWSPKGNLIAFTARDERNVFDIFTIDVSTGEVLRLTQDQGHNREPSWSPDGRYLVFESTRDGKQPRLYLMNQDGRWQTRLSAMPGLRTPTWHR